MANTTAPHRTPAAKSTAYRIALVLGAASVLAIAAQASPDEDCRESREITAEISLDGIRDIAIVAGAGKLTVVGQSDLTVARIKGLACARREGDLDKFAVESRRDGATLNIETVLPSPSMINFGNSSPTLDLEVQVPASYAIRIDDTSGSLTVQGVESVAIEDNSGSILVQDVAGLVHVLEDGSGSITVERSGSVRIEEDGSGSISASDIVADVYVGDDGSGSISVDSVGGSFTVVSDGSGSVRHSNVAGAVNIDD